MTRLDGRVRALERRERLEAGCPECGGRRFHVVEPGEGIPAWLDGSSCCRGCGVGVKLVDRELLDLL
jgi:hypothetical protein